MGGRLEGRPGEELAFCQGDGCGPEGGSLFVLLSLSVQDRHASSLPPPSLKGGALLRHGPGEYLLLGNRFFCLVGSVENHGTGLAPSRRHDALEGAVSDERVELPPLGVDVFHLHVGRANRLVSLLGIRSFL